MAAIELVRNKNSFLLCIDGFLYYKHSQPKGNFKWKCKNKPACYASVTTNPVADINDEVFIIRGGPDVSLHKCISNVEVVETIKVTESLKRKAVDHPEAAPIQILRDLNVVPSEVLAELSSRFNLRKAMTRERNRHIPTNPMSIEDLYEIAEEYAIKLDGKTIRIVRLS